MSTAQKPAENAPASPTGELPKAYIPKEHEGRVWSRWIDARAFHADPARVLRGEAEPYCIVIPPPNVTAALHLGHALNNSLQDILIRAHRMKGFETLWMPGTDHAGIATQAVVERRLRKEGKLKGSLKEAMTREAFVAEAQAFKDEYEATITGQLKAMGCSCDWDRQRFTMDEAYSASVREAFFRLFKDGLIYRGKRLVNWDPALQTAVSDDECYDEEVDSFFYYLRYPLVHPHGATTQKERRQGQLPPDDPVPVTWSELEARGYIGAESRPGEEQAWVTVATTRPETYLADTAVAVNPNDPRARALRGLCVELPLVGRVIPIVEDDYVVLPKTMARTDEEAADPKAEFATGFLKVTPGHDANDYELYQRHKDVMDAFAGGANAALINMMSPDGRVSDKHGWTDVGDAHLLVGKTMAEARKQVVKEFEARGVGGNGDTLLEGVRPYRQSLTFSDRSKAVIEPYLSDQWYVRVTDPRLAAAANEALTPEQRTRKSEEADGGQGGTGTGIGGDRVGGTGVPPVPGDPYARFAPISSNLNIHQRNLPHFQEGGRTYFVTFRVRAGELSERERQIVLDACRHWNGERMELRAAVVMPDHVHLLISPFEKESGHWFSLSELLHSIKSFTAHELGKLRGTTGPIWQDESFDRIVRDRDELAEKLSYMQRNPVKAGLAGSWKDYPFTWISDEAMDGRLKYADRVLGTYGHRRDACATSADDPGADGTMRFFPARYAKTFEMWHENIRDWCISRQLWWGHRIPVWRGEADAIGVRLAEEKWIGEGAATERSSMHRYEVNGVGVVSQYRSEGDALFEYVCIPPNIANVEGFFEARGYRQDTDVLDTWFSSALWPMATMHWPDLNSETLRAFNPTSTLCTAREIITLWVSRMTMFNRYFLPTEWKDAGARRQGAAAKSGQPGKGNGPIPFRDVFIHAVIQDGEGRKMSKTLGNGVDPLDIIATHGADAMRFTLCQMATNTQDVRMPVARDAASGRNTSPKFDLGRNFCNKLWNAARFAIGLTQNQAGETDASRPIEPATLRTVDRWMLSRLARAVREVNQALANYEFASYAQTMYTLLWNDFCDWYLEAIKPTVATDANQRAVLRAVLDAILRLLHPITPFVTEAIYERFSVLPGASIRGLELAAPRKAGLLSCAGWPAAADSLIDERAEAEFGRLQAFVTAIREVRAQHNVKPSRRIALHADGPAAALVKESGGLIETLGLIDQVTPVDQKGSPAVGLRFESTEVFVSNLAEAVDAETEKARLGKQKTDLEKTIATLQGRLDNPGYAQKAPPAMVEQTQSQLAKAQAEHAATLEALKKLA